MKVYELLVSTWKRSENKDNVSRVCQGSIDLYKRKKDAKKRCEKSGSWCSTDRQESLRNVIRRKRNPASVRNCEALHKRGLTTGLFFTAPRIETEGL